MLAGRFAGEVEGPHSDEVCGDEVGLWAGEAFALSEAVWLCRMEVWASVDLMLTLDGFLIGTVHVDLV